MTPTKKERKNTSGSISKSKGQATGQVGTTIKAFIADLASHDDVVREKARHSLVAMGRRCVPWLTEALRNGKYLMRWEAAKALGQIAAPESAPVLVEALEDNEFDVRWLAAEGLIKLNVKGLKSLLHALMKKTDSGFLREGAHHVIHDLAKGALRKPLAPVLASLEDGKMTIEAPEAAFKALEMLEKKGRRT